MEKIHVTHSKKELCEIIEVFDIKIANYKKMNKPELSKHLLYELSKINDIKEDNDYFFIKNKDELIEYLTNPDCSKELTIKEKSNVMELSKYIIMYCKNNYYLSYSPFMDYDDLIDKAKYIANYGDIPTVRRAIELLNEDNKLDKKIDIIMSSKMKKKLERKKRIKQQYIGCLKINRGKFILDFSV